MNSDGNSNSGGNNGTFSRRTVLRVASGAGLALIAGAASGGVGIERAMAQAGDTQLRCTTSGVRLRSRPSLSGTIIGTLNEGEIVNLTGQPVAADGISWLPITGARGPGFAASQFFAASQGGFQIGTDVVTTTSVRLRRQAGLGGAVIRTLPPGTHALIRWAPIRKDGFTWYGVLLDDGTEGFVAGEFLTYARVEPTGQRLRVVDGPLRLRRDPGFGGAVLASLPTGTTLFIADDTSVTRDGYLWRYVRVDAKPGATGWVADVFTVPIDY